MPSASLIRPARAADLPAILAIYNDAILTTTAVYSYAPHTLEMRQDWFAAKQRDGHPVLVAVDQATVIGFGAFGPFRVWPAYKYSVEHSVYVDPNARRRGVGQALLARLIDTARELDMHAVLAGIDASNEASIRLHTRAGFREVAHFREVGYKFGRWLDLKFFELLLDTPVHPSGAAP